MKKNFLLTIVVWFGATALSLGQSGPDVFVPSRFVNDALTLEGDRYQAINERDTSQALFAFFEPGRQEQNSLPLVKKFPHEPIPGETFRIVFPDLAQASDTLGIMWCFKQSDAMAQHNILNITLVSQDSQGKLAYHFDKNNNRDFTDDGPAYFFDDQTPQVSVKIEDPEKGAQTLQMANPEMEDYRRQELERQQYERMIANMTFNDQWQRSRLRPKLNLAFHLGSSSGDIDLNFDVVDPEITNIRYEATVYGSSRLTTDLSLSFKGFYLGATAAVEKLELGVQNRYQTTLVSVDPIETVTTQTHRSGFWPDFNLHYGLFAEYDIRINNNIRLSPRVFGMRSHFLRDRVFDQAFGQGSLHDTFRNHQAAGFGLKFKYLLSPSLLLQFYASQSYWSIDATSYFLEIVPETYRLEYRTRLIGVGLQYRFDFRKPE